MSQLIQSVTCSLFVIISEICKKFLIEKLILQQISFIV